MPRIYVVAIGSAGLWAVYAVMTRHVVAGAGLDPWAYALVQLLAGGVVILWFGRSAPGGWASLFAPWMLGYGVLRVAVAGSTAAGMAYLLAAQSSLLGTTAVTIGAAMALLLFRAAPSVEERRWLLVLVAAQTLLIGFLIAEGAGMGVVWCMTSELCAVASALAVERNPRNRADSPAARHRFTAETLIVTSVVLILAWSAAGAVGWTSSPWAPRGRAFGDPELWAWGIAAGLFFRGPGQWLSLYSVRHIGAQGYLISLLCLPLLTLAFELACGAVGLTPKPSPTWIEWTVVALIAAAATGMMRARLAAVRAVSVRAGSAAAGG